MNALENEIERLLVEASQVTPAKVDAVVELAQSITERATAEDVALIISAMRSPKADCWSRELLSEAACYYGGPEHLEDLIELEQLGQDEGHDNDAFCTFLSDMVEQNPEACGQKLRELLARDGYPYEESAEWLLEFAEEAAH